MANAPTYDAPKRYIVKRYDGNRLYDVMTRAYVTPDQLRALAANHAEVAIYEADSGEDITELVLARA
jgi:polyhydroxyalkanoate synthesis regulator protein